MNKTLPTYFLSHGGGPWPWMMDEMPGVFDHLNQSLKSIPATLPAKPKALLVITAHWITQTFSISSHSNPSMIYDYGGFAEKYYHIQYPAPGSPELAKKVEQLLLNAEIEAQCDQERGFDHGTYTVTYPMYPLADIPVVQLSILRSFDPESHFKCGQALASLRDEGILIIGSGFSYHNLRRFGPEASEPSAEFDHWLQETMKLEPKQRKQNLFNWMHAPSARLCHPKEDHLIPLMVVVGAAEHQASQLIYHENQFMGGCSVSSFRFG